MNESPSPYERSPKAGPEDMWSEFPQRLTSECLRSLDMIELSKKYMMNIVSKDGDAHYDELRESLSDISVAAGRLGRSLLTMSSLVRCLQKTAQPCLEEVELCRFLRDLCMERDAVRELLSVEIVLDVPPAAPCWVRADRSYLTQICLNLLSNALRACSAPKPKGQNGRIDIVLCPGDGGYTLRFADNGCGLPGRGNDKENYRCFLGGTRNGLLLCREYCALLGWALELRPRADACGAEAVLRIPACEECGGRPLFSPDRPGERSRLWLCLTQELSCVPGLEALAFKNFSDFT